MLGNKIHIRSHDGRTGKQISGDGHPWFIESMRNHKQQKVIRSSLQATSCVLLDNTQNF